jgi:outer membrane receptor protein involved in Fe transport
MRCSGTVPSLAGSLTWVVLMTVSSPAASAAEGAGRRIEEVVVTAERRESTVSDTAISISAFDSTFLDNFNIRNQEDLQNYIPATTIQPYDASIRGVGRTARTLGGDPGVSTYFNGVYSEDFGIASTEGGLHDLERVEVLRGPQGTLYGRNAVGGAINFVSRRPSLTEVEGEVKGTYGSFDTREIYYMLSGPVIKDRLAVRVTGSDRRRDGYIEETSPFGKDINNYGDENYTLSFEWAPAERVTIYARGNERSYRRRFNGGAGTNPILVSENGQLSRDTTSLAFGKRAIDRSQTSAPWQSNYFDSSQEVFSFTNPITGAVVEAQDIRPGVDIRSAFTAPLDANADGVQDIDPVTGLPAFGKGDPSAGQTSPNYALGMPADRIHIADRDNLDEGDLKIDSNGQYDEFFDHQAVQFNFIYDGDNWQFKYIGGYTDFFYDRNTDEDKTGNTRLGSSDFYVLQENHNWQHELQLIFDTERLSVTTGAFVYESAINQRLDLYDPIDTQGRYQGDAAYSGLTGGAAEFGGVLEFLGAVGGLGFTGAQTAPLLDIYTAQRQLEAGNVQINPATGAAVLIAPWYGDTGTGLRGARHDGVTTPGTFFAWDNDIETRAYAAYAQGEYQLAEKWALTLGVRYARDEKTGRERLIGVQESVGLTAFALFDAGSIFAGAPAPGGGTLDYIVNNPAGFAACGSGANLLCLYNAVNGAIDPSGATANGGIQVGDQGTNPGEEAVWFSGVPITFNVFREIENDWDVWTWRGNLDFEPNPDTLLYLSVTTGWRSGGYNLGFFSTATPEYDEEDIIAYELGYKGTLLNGRLQLNSSVFLYQYDNIHTIISQSGGLLGVSTNVVNAPEARTIGWEGEVIYLIGERFTLGGNWSYTDAEFTKDFAVVDVNNPDIPGSVFTAAERTVSGFDGSSLPKIPEWKFTLWGNYTVPLGNAGSLDLFTTVGYTDDFYFGAPFSRELDRAPSFVRWDARASWKSASENWDVSMFVNNITNELGVRNLDIEGGEELNFLRSVATTDPRVYGMSLTYRLNP